MSLKRALLILVPVGLEINRKSSKWIQYGRHDVITVARHARVTAAQLSLSIGLPLLRATGRCVQHVF